MRSEYQMVQVRPDHLKFIAEIELMAARQLSLDDLPASHRLTTIPESDLNVAQKHALFWIVL